MTTFERGRSELLAMIAVVSANARDPLPSCWVRSGKSYRGRTWIDLIDGEEASAREAARAEAEMRPRDSTPIHGMVYLHVERSSIDLANASNQLIIIESGGQQIVRYEPEPDVAELPGGLYRYWWNTFVIPIPDDAQFPLTVHETDWALAHRCSWTIGWDGQIRGA